MNLSQGVDFSRVEMTLINMANGTLGILPELLVAFVIFMLFFFVAKRIRTIVILMTERRQRTKNAGLVLGRLAQSVVVVTGVLVALTVIFPSFRPGDLIQLLGIGSVAIGFAFHDLFQNFLAGILLLLTAPFKLGDEILVEGYEGTVEDIQTRATTIRTYDDRRIVIPNADLFTHSVTVNTAFSKRRLEYEVGIGYGDDIERVKALMLEVLNDIDDVLKDPPAEVFVVSLGESSVNLRVYWWTLMIRHTHILQVQDRVLTMLKNRLFESGVDLPYPTQQVLVKMQKEASNGAHPAVQEVD